MAAPCGPSLSVEVLNGGRARVGKRPVSEYGPGARRGQPEEVLGLPDPRNFVHVISVPPIYYIFM